MYNVGKPEESFEWTRLSELSAAELWFFVLVGMYHIDSPRRGILPDPSPPIAMSDHAMVAARSHEPFLLS